MTALLTASAALIGVYLTNKANVEHIKIRLGRESKEKHRILIRERAEELYELADDWIKGMFTNYLHLTSVMQDKLDYNQYLDFVIEDGEKRKGNFTRLEMILNIYFSELVTAYEAVT